MTLLFLGILTNFVEAQTTTRVSVTSGGIQADGENEEPSISDDGRFIVWESSATNLVPGDTNGFDDVLLHDRNTGEITRVSVDSNATQALGGTSSNAVISGDGRFVAFNSEATNLVPGDTNGERDVFVHDLQTGQTTRVSVNSTGLQALGGESGGPSISADGRYVSFDSEAINLVSGDTNGEQDVFVHDRLTGKTTRVSVTSSGNQTQGGASSVISADGQIVAFHSSASDLVEGDTNGLTDIFVHDRQTGETTRVSVDSSGNQALGGGSREPEISSNGLMIGFESEATNLVLNDTNNLKDVFCPQSSDRANHKGFSGQRW